MVELDHEIKGKKAFLNTYSPLFEKHRELLSQKYRKVKKGFLAKDLNIVMALDKHGGINKFKEAQNPVET